MNQVSGDKVMEVGADDALTLVRSSATDFDDSRFVF
jgi:hypothetical protein